MPHFVAGNIFILHAFYRCSFNFINDEIIEVNSVKFYFIRPLQNEQAILIACPLKSPNSPPYHPPQPLVLLMEWPDASNFACLISGYYKLFVDPKRTIYFRTSGQSQLTKAGMLEIFLTCRGWFWTNSLIRQYTINVKEFTEDNTVYFT